MEVYMELSVGKLAKSFKISRSTLLYYDSINLLKPSGRSLSRYRIYNEIDMNKLKQIILYREVGVPLNEISELLAASEINIVPALLKRLGDLIEQINIIKEQQDIIVKILKNGELNSIYRDVDKEIWENILDSAGITKDVAHKWHADFEKNSPEQHNSFLSILGLNEHEIKQMREYYANLNSI
jgi:MerR family transcriptional regulator, thiopeptide resistance regulator